MAPSQGEATARQTGSIFHRCRRGLGIGLFVAVLAGAGLWFFVFRTETPQSYTRREVDRILSEVRRREGSSAAVYSLFGAMRNWPKPFPKVAKLILGDENTDVDPRRDLAALGPLAVPILTNILAHDRTPGVRAVVAEAIGEMGDTRLVPALLAAFEQDADKRVRGSAVRALGELQNERALPPLIAALHSARDQGIRSELVQTLGEFNTPQTLSALTNALARERDDWVRQWVVMSERPWQSDPAARPALLAALRAETNANVRVYVVRALKNHPDETTIRALISALREDPDARLVRAAVADTLGRLTNALIRPALLEATEQNTSEVRGAAIRALQFFPGLESEARVRAVLQADAVPVVREAAARALGEWAARHTNHALLPALIAALQHDPSPEVRAAAAAALDRVGGAEVIKVLREVLATERKGRVQVEAIGGIYRHASAEAAAFLLQLLDSGNLEADAEAETVRGLGELRAFAAIPKLTARLASSPDETVRQAAVEALGNLEATNQVAVLLTALGKDDSPGVRSEVATLLGRMPAAGQAEIRSALIQALGTDGDSSVRAAAAGALGERRDPAALPALVKALQRDEDREVRARAATALGKLGRPEAAPPLETAFQRDRDKTVRTQAVRSLARLTGPDHAEFFLKGFVEQRRLRAELADLLGWLGSPGAIAALRQAFAEGVSAERSAVIHALGDAGDVRVVAELGEIVRQDPAATTRAAAATALGRLCDSNAVPALVAALQDRIVSVRQEAAWALGHIGAAAAVPALTNALGESNADVRFAAAFALAEIGDRSAASALMPLVQHSEERTRLAAASALAFLDREDGLAVLAAMVRSDDVWMRFTALISLLRLNTAAARQQLTDCQETDATLAAVIAGGLRVGGVCAATNMLCTARDSDSMMNDFRHFGARALVLFNDPSARPALQANANDAREEVRVAVRVALRRLAQRDAPGPAAR